MAYNEQMIRKKGLYTVAHAAEVLGLTYQTLLGRIRKNLLPKPTTEVEGYRRRFYTLSQIEEMKEMI